MNAEYIVNNLAEGLITKKEAVTLIKENARQACEAQRQSCVKVAEKVLEDWGGLNPEFREILLTAPDPELL